MTARRRVRRPWRLRPSVAALLVGTWGTLVSPAVWASVDLDTFAVFAGSSLHAKSLDVPRGDVGVNLGPLDVHGKLDAPTSTVTADLAHLGAASRCAGLFLGTGDARERAWRSSISRSTTASSSSTTATPC